MLGERRRRPSRLDTEVGELCKTRRHIDLSPVRADSQRCPEPALPILPRLGDIPHIHHNRAKQAKAARLLGELRFGLAQAERSYAVDHSLEVGSGCFSFT